MAASVASRSHAFALQVPTLLDVVLWYVQRYSSAQTFGSSNASQVAIKTMKKTFDSFSSCLELREVIFLRSLPPHPHLVPALDIFLDPYSRRLHIAMEFMDGNLYQLMKARDHKPMDAHSVKSILFQILSGLEHIHDREFFHRDIKPENILVSTSQHNDTSHPFRRYSAMMTPPSTPPVYTIKIADFGLARETHSKLPYTTYVSTRWYRAPEVLLRAGQYSAPVDIWAVGAMAVEIATLKPLFPGGNEVDQVWRVCEIMGSPGGWVNKYGQRVGGGEWKEGVRLAQKLGFSFPKMAPHSLDTILPTPQWPASLSQFVTWCLLWDPRARPTSAQALAHEYFQDAVDPLRLKSSSSRLLGRKQSELSNKDSPDPQASAQRPHHGCGDHWSLVRARPQSLNTQQHSNLFRQRHHLQRARQAQLCHLRTDQPQPSELHGQTVCLKMAHLSQFCPPSGQSLHFRLRSLRVQTYVLQKQTNMPLRRSGANYPRHRMVITTPTSIARRQSVH
jgi:serine/threonine protein kinase